MLTDHAWRLSIGDGASAQERVLSSFLRSCAQELHAEAKLRSHVHLTSSASPHTGTGVGCQQVGAGGAGGAAAPAASHTQSRLPHS